MLTEAQVRGIAVPGQLAIMGFGDLNFSAHTSPSISSIHIDKRAIGIQAANALLARIEGRPVADTHEHVAADRVRYHLRTTISSPAGAGSA